MISVWTIALRYISLGRKLQMRGDQNVNFSDCLCQSCWTFRHFGRCRGKQENFHHESSFACIQYLLPSWTHGCSITTARGPRHQMLIVCCVLVHGRTTWNECTITRWDSRSRGSRKSMQGAGTLYWYKISSFHTQHECYIKFQEWINMFFMIMSQIPVIKN